MEYRITRTSQPRRGGTGVKHEEPIPGWAMYNDGTSALISRGDESVILRDLKYLIEQDALRNDDDVKYVFKYGRAPRYVAIKLSAFVAWLECIVTPLISNARRDTIKSASA